MKSDRRRNAIPPAAIMVAGLVIVTGPSLVAQQTSLEGQVDEIFAAWDSPDSAGCAVSIMRNGSIVYKQGYGMANLEYGVPITPSSIFHVASVSKQFTAFAVMLLATQGKISLDDDVRKHVPEVPDFGPTITIRHLIHHASGLRDQWSLLGMAGWRFEGDVITQKDVLDITSRQTALNFEPGAEYLYSNTGYTLLGVIVERISGVSLREFARENIFEPLGMRDTHFHDDHRMIVKNRAYAYGRTGEDDALKTRIPDFDVVGATSLFTTVEDLAKWDRNFYDARVGGSDLIEQMHVRGVLQNGNEIPYAFALVHGEHRGLRTVGHGGADAGYRANFVRYPDQGVTIAVLCNFPSSDPGGKARQVAGVYLADEFTEPADGDGGAEEPVEISDAERTRVAGVYSDPATDLVVVVNNRDGSLTAGSGGDGGRPLVHLGSHRFRVANSSQILALEFSSPNGEPRLRLPSDAGDRVLQWAPFANPTSEQLAEYTGTYHSDELGIAYEFFVRDGKLLLRHRKRDGVTLAPTMADRFGYGGQGITFTRDRGAKIDGFTMSSGRVRRVRFERVGA